MDNRPQPSDLLTRLRAFGIIIFFLYTLQDACCTDTRLLNGFSVSMSACVGTDGQSAAAGTAVTRPPAVLVCNDQGIPLPLMAVTFTIVSGGGRIDGAITMTDAQGVASVSNWILGTIPGTNTLTASCTNLSINAVTFSAQGLPASEGIRADVPNTASIPARQSVLAVAGTPTTLTVWLGDGQTAYAGSAVYDTPTVFVSDQFGNAVPNVVIDFTIEAGSGSVTNAHTSTGADGLAMAGAWTLGATAGVNRLRATAPAIPAASALFTATAIVDAAQAKMQISFQTQSPNGDFAPNNIVVVWVKKNDGTFIKTISDWSGELFRHNLNQWNASSGGADVDAILGPTRQDHTGTLTAKWDLIPHSGSTPIPDGNYLLCFEVADSEGGANNLHPTLPFTISGGKVAPMGPLTLAGISHLTINQTSTPSTPSDDQHSCGIGSTYSFMLVGLLLMLQRRFASGTYKNKQ